MIAILFLILVSTNSIAEETPASVVENGIDWTACTSELASHCLSDVQDRAKHDCLGKLDVALFSKECLAHFKSLCRQYGKRCGRHRPIPKSKKVK